MKTLDTKRIYRRGLVGGVTLGILLGAVMASWLGGAKFRGSAFATPTAPVRRFEVVNGLFGALFGLAAGLGVGLGTAALIVALSSGEAREKLRDEPEPVVEDTGLAHAFPGVFGSADPFEPFKRKIEAEEPEGEEEAAKPPEKMPEKCPSCGEKLEADEPSAFCYHCGASLS